MSDDNLLSRRQSLLGIGAVGTALGGGALGVSGVFDSEETAEDKTKGDKQKSGNGDKTGDQDDQDDETAAKAGLELEVVCHEGGEAKVRVRNKRSDEAELSWKVDIDGLDLDDLDIDDLDDLDEDDFDEDDLAALEAYAQSQGLNVTAEDLEHLEGKQIELDGTTLDLGKKTIDLEKLAEKKGVDLEDTEFDLDKLYGKVTVPKGGVESFWAAALSKDSNVELYYDGKRIESVSVDTAACQKSTMADKIDLEAVCYRTRTVDFGDLDDHSLDNADGSTVSGVSEDFDPDGETIVNGEEVDEDDLDDLDDVFGDSGPSGAGDLEGLEGTATVREAKFCVHNHGKEDVKLGWTVNSDTQGGKCYVDAKGSDSFWVTVLDDQKTSVTVTYNGEAVDTEKADTDTECTDDHDDDDDDDT